MDSTHQHPIPSEHTGSPVGDSVVVYYYDGLGDILSVVFVFGSFDPLSFLHTVTCSIFLLKMLPVLSLAHVKAEGRSCISSRLALSVRSLQPVELHKLNTLHKLTGTFFLLLFGRKLSFSKY